MLEDADQLYHSVRAEREELAGDLVAGIYSPLAPFLAPKILTVFKQRHPAVKLSFLEADQAGLIRALAEGACETALMYDLGLGAEYEYLVLQQVPPHLLVSANHPRAATPDEPVYLRDFESEPFILLDLKHSREYYLDIFKQLGVRPRVRHLVSGYETVRSYVGMGHGYSLLNWRLAREGTYSGGNVVALELADELPPTELVLVRLPAGRPTRKSLAFVEVCAELLSG